MFLLRNPSLSQTLTHLIGVSSRLSQEVDLEKLRDSLEFPEGIEAALMLLRISKVKVAGSHPDVPLYGIT